MIKKKNKKPATNKQTNPKQTKNFSFMESVWGGGFCVCVCVFSPQLLILSLHSVTMAIFPICLLLNDFITWLPIWPVVEMASIFYFH